MKRIIKYRWLIIGFSIGITVLLSFSLHNISVDPDMKNYFPEKMKSMVATNAIEERFGNQDIIMIIFETGDIINAESLQRIKAVERQLKRISGIRKTTSLFGSNRIYGQDGMMFVEPAVKRIPVTPEEVEEVKKNLRENDLVMNMVVADDFRSSAILATLSQEAVEDSVFHAIHAVLKEIPGKEKVHFGGLPYLRQAINKDIRRDGLILVPAALLLMLIFLLVVFREFRGVLLPFLVVI
ncbi:MAG: MMPL family transporter, partial [Bacteroidales bacterium]|nr:MMPL family transporter [Bacteroidales bacterium]